MTRTSARRDAERAFGRYREIIGDFAAFTDALDASPPTVVWAHPARIEREALAALFASDGIESAPLAWDAHALVLSGVHRPGKHWAHWAGLFYVQEAASLLAPRALDPRPGERVLDLCAAPGGKTARIALALANRGTVVANDRSIERLAALSATIARLGLLNVTCTVGDGTSYPLEAGPFDAVLVDAPCSAEGNAQKNAAWRTPDPAFRAWVSGVQRALLRRAASLCRPGGRIVYSTCTFAPEENEAVVDAVVRESDGALRVVPIDAIEGLAVSPGLTEWEGARFLPELRFAARLWPHVSGTGGFFVARIERRAEDTTDAGFCEPPERLGIDARQSELLARFAARFGMGEDAFEGLRLVDAGRYARVVADGHRVPVGPRIVSTGLPIARRASAGAGKLSTAGALAFGRRATKCIADVEQRGAYAFQAREVLAIPAEARTDIERGYVLVRFGEHPLGLGMVRSLDGIRRLESEIPSAWARTATGRWSA